MARTEAPIVGVGPAAEFARRLRRLRVEAGLSYRALSAVAGYSPASLSLAANGRQLPGWAVTEAFVTACGDDPGQWRTVWEQARSTVGRPAHADYAIGRDSSPVGTALQFRILGPVRVNHGGTDLPPLGSKGRSLLAMLLLNANHRVSLSLLSEAWASDYGKGTNTLQSDISRLRKALIQGVTVGEESGLLINTTGGYQLMVEEEQLDLTRFRRRLATARDARREGRLDQAVQLYREALGEWSGEPLADVDGFRFEGERRALVESRRAAQLESLEILFDLGQYHEVAIACWRLEAELPFDEHIAGLLMSALHSMGRSADALGVYRGLSDRLREGLGLEPNRRLQPLQRAILNGEPVRPRLYSSADNELR